MLGILFIGDIVGRPGRRALPAFINKIKRQHQVDLIVANGENSAGGTGITRKVANEIFAAGVDVITSGNHIWDKKEALDLLDEEKRILRPANYPPGVPGAGFIVVEVGLPPRRIVIINVCGRVFMPDFDCPFRVTEQILNAATKTNDIILIDIHAEATSEKAALAHYFDGRVTAVFGTHTHVQTNDASLLPKGTAFLTDAGMVGAKNSIIGVEPGPVIHKFLTGLPARFQVAEGPVSANGVYISVAAGTSWAATEPHLLKELLRDY